MEKDQKIIITGAAGLVGQNLVTLLLDLGYTNIVALDKNQNNLEILSNLHPEVTAITANLSDPGPWDTHFQGASRLFLLHAQITGSTWEEFSYNTLDSTRLVLQAAKQSQIPFTIFVGSSVIHSVKSDNYSRSKQEQEQMTLDSKLPSCVLRPTLLFGWFDPKHLGWLSRFMEKYPIFPIPGHGNYLRQPLYVRDFCRALIWCMENTPQGKAYDLTGSENVTYLEIIKTIKKIKKLKTLIIKLPCGLFRFLMKFYSIFSKHPPFVADQLDSLIAGDFFTGDSFLENFGFTTTPFYEAMAETLTKKPYSSVTLKRS
ncbi:MAG: NAD(P)-dependent oxidoreductase [Deltaproteobacteria bacterium]|jgi:nucleoside-diphosphate-sugar epimerase|nr:NAD(P)-dependent oxidoreductase [Deltaproteobacteria bacterium]